MHMEKKKCLSITHLEWGKIEVQGMPPFKDAKLFPGGATEWDWGKTNTRHSPGIQIADVEELLLAKPTHIILSRGMQLVLQTKPDTLAYLQERSLQLEVLETKLAVQKYNQLVESGIQVAGLFHSTC
jgi:hypothetical protein